MSAELSLDAVKSPTEILVDKAIAKHVGMMKAELMSICHHEVKCLKTECASLRQKLSVLRLQVNSDEDKDGMNPTSREKADVDTTEDTAPSALQGGTEQTLVHHAESSAHILRPELGVAFSTGNTSQAKILLERTGWQAFLQKVVLHTGFELFALTVVVLNVVILGVQTNQLARGKIDRPFEDAAFIVELCCCIFFVVEVSLRILANWKYFFYGPGWILNTFDFILVAAQVFEMCLSVVVVGKDLSEKRSVNFALWRILRLARVIRLVQSARLLVMFAEVRSTALSVVLAMKPLIGAMVVMLLLCYAFSIVLIELAHSEIKKLEVSRDDDGRLQQLQFHFGSLGSAVLTLLHCALTSSASYGFKDVSALFSDWWVHDILMPCFMVLTMLGMLNIITGIFVESTNRQLVQDQAEILETITSNTFHQIGHTHGANIYRSEFMRIIDSGECDKLLDVMDLDKRDVRNLWSLICFEADSKHGASEPNVDLQCVSLDALVNAIIRMSSAPRRIDLLMILGMLEELAESADKILQVMNPDALVNRSFLSDVQADVPQALPVNFTEV